ncbi:Fanconi anemia core complex-associated protein 100 isoform X1 [Polypterus senegalus]|uniref:Fanconi anemia core complex-associated protein 100 isoform X1 n=1 Tax=Polypterus senegalus TaxID=55291 RepID=UPI001963CCE9|nr:Fanconi anemia core complex-associated protein 100 isoform X1 [Polypterus senegalus]XP_039596036.1 Fanconi anemia core complex-associated protein 100 isoform X1 [Polypterus senegalus]XP_039596037.1 Fanconi anemia core complex-associated protein 100 isoform X1 [Polypterus senegalus]
MANRRCIVDYLAKFHCPLYEDVFASVHVIQNESFIYLCNGTEFVAVYSKCEKQIVVVYQFPGKACLMEEDSKQHCLFVLCENYGLFSVILHLKDRFSSESQQRGASIDTCRVSLDACIIKDPTIHSFILVQNLIITVGQKCRVRTLSIFGNPQLGQVSYEKIEELDVPILENVIISSDKKQVRMPPYLCCVYPHGQKQMPSRGIRNFSLEPQLFTLLFGVDATMLDSPVILCGFLDGQVYYLPLRQSVTCTDDLRSRNSVFRMLYHLGQPVRFIGAMLPNDKGNSTLLLVGHYGKIIQIKTEYHCEGSLPNFIERNILGPVISVHSSATHIYYSTPSDLMTLPLSNTSEESTSSVSDAPAIENNLVLFFQSPHSLNVCKIIAVSCPTEMQTGEVELVAFSLAGKLMKIRISRGPSKTNSSRLSTAQTGQRIKDLLSGIGNVSDRASLLKSKIQSKNDSLKRLNRVFNICCMLQSCQERKEENCKETVHCHVVAKWNHLLLQDSLNLTCALENSSSYILEEGWMLCVEVKSQSYSMSSDSKHFSRLYTFPIAKLLPAQTMEVSVPLSSLNDLFLYALVHCTLIYNFQGILGYQENGRQQDQNSFVSSMTFKNCICLPLKTQTVDILDYLRLANLATLPRELVIKPVTDLVDVFLNTSSHVIHHCSEQIPLKRETRFSLEDGNCVASIKVSTELLKCGLTSTTSGVTFAASTVAWLLSSNSEADLLSLPSHPVVTATTPTGKSIKIHAKEISLNDLSADLPVSAVEIQIESSSLIDFCSLHWAILQRIQLLMNLKDSGGGAQPAVQMQFLWGLLHQSEVLAKKVQEVRDHLCLGLKISSEATEKLLSAYQQLRSMELVIL